MSNYKLTYFNGRGRAELTRLIFHAVGQSFIDERITDWPGHKDQTPLGQLPYLTTPDGIKIPQSISIARYIARKFHMAGKDELEHAQTDAVVDTVVDLANAFYENTHQAKDKEAGKAKFLTELAPIHLERLEKIIGMYGSNGFSVGSSLKWSDLAVFNLTSELKDLQDNLLDKYPHILSVRKTVESNTQIAQYLSSRPQTAF